VIVTGWAFTDTRNSTRCPRCKAEPGDVCRTPGGRKNDPPHGERGAAYLAAIGAEEYKRRHMRGPAKTLGSVLGEREK